MLNVNEMVIETHGFFSKKGLESFFLMPDTYLADNIQELTEDIKIIKPRWKPFCKPEFKQYTEGVCIFIFNCVYKNNLPSKESYLRIEELKKQRKELKQLTKKDISQWSQKHSEISDLIIDESKNAKIYDKTASFRLFSNKFIADNTPLYNVLLFYEPMMQAARLIGYDLKRTEERTDTINYIHLIKQLYLH